MPEPADFAGTSGNEGVIPILPRGVDAWLYILVSSKYASYYEIKYLLEVEDVLDLLEIALVHNCNKAIIVENISNEF